MSVFKPDEIFQFAIRIEENGEKFYRSMADKLKEKSVKELFNSLADDELKHKETYKQMVADIEKYEPVETYPGEYFDYLRAYADNHVFSPDKINKEIDRINDAESALNFAMARELDSILYYQEVKQSVSKQGQEKIEAIINEERKHYLKLAGCKDAVCVRKETR
jgi:rubrerythrin